MGFFDCKWIVTYEYNDGLFGGLFSNNTKKELVVEASSEYDAKRTAKTILEQQHKYVKVISAKKK